MDASRMRANYSSPYVLLALLLAALNGFSAPSQTPASPSPEAAVIEQKLDQDQWEAALQAAADIQREGLALKKQIQKLQKAAEDEDPAEIAELEQKKNERFSEAARQMERLSNLPADPKLADMAALRAGQNYMRAESYESATRVFEKIVGKQAAEEDLRAQALYWSGICHEKMKAPHEAARLYKSITVDFPESKWAKYARGRLADPMFQE